MTGSRNGTDGQQPRFRLPPPAIRLHLLLRPLAQLWVTVRCWASPHQLRHSCATLLLNAGTPVLTVQTILGHKYIDTTLGYARLYDGTLTADYYRAMIEIEGRLELSEDTANLRPDSGELLALIDTLHTGKLSEVQRRRSRRCGQPF